MGVGPFVSRSGYRSFFPRLPCYLFGLFGLGFYGISTIVSYLMPHPLYTYISNIYDLVGLVLWHVNHCWGFNAESSLYVYIKYI